MLHQYSNELSCNTEDNWTLNSLSEETNPKNKDYYRPNKQKNTTDTANRKEIPMWNRCCVELSVPPKKVNLIYGSLKERKNTSL